MTFYEVSDDEIMEANGFGMDAYDNGESIHNNPYEQYDLRHAWHDGWKSAERHREDSAPQSSSCQKP